MYNQYPPPSHSPQPPYGYPPPQGHSPYPQQPGYGAPPPGPPPQGYYPSHGHAPPPPAPYGAPPSQGYPTPQQPPYGQHQPYPPPQQAYNRPPVPPPAPYGSHPHHQPPAGQYPPSPQYGALQGPPSAPSPGYVPGQMAPGDFRRDADVLRKAMKGFGTDEAALIQVLSRLDPLQMAAVRSTYSSHIGRDLYKDVKSETGGYFEKGLLGIIDGPLIHDATLVHDAVAGLGTKEWMLNDVLLGRSNADLNAIKAAYHHRYGRSLQKDVEDDLSAKTKELFTSVIVANRHEESMPLDPARIESEARTIHGATAGRIVNNVTEVCTIFAKASDNELRAINHAFQSRYNSSLEKHVEKEFSGHMKDALLHMLRTATDPAMRDALLLEDCMKGAGTKDEKLVVRIVRLHWNRDHKEQVKRAYYHRFKVQLADRVRAETSGDYQKLMLALLA
ncbi:hypothetical protein DTO271D3_5741 [Paecilomyces variotii]|nr:hypothetical protein DTO169C6_8554 [Paecilomyces variotii]KAJ9240875.1 hypothetical protein DTO169E5_3792 [Paecilomyces variotii]KAJ9251584.1 hypothetical protein DTO207G8_5264 [Paecilomyces variotii]KAJ9314053.1 hypothetical protein DTO271D3_5741 [Paecilomyces variotii]KAJ9383903.1 hypothetical protein DTO063F5_5007 [Paecilomyces variotii]